MKRKTIEGLPPVAKRTRCACCRKAMRPTYDSFRADGSKTYSDSEAVRFVFTGYQGYPRENPIFDTMECGMRYGAACVDMVRSGEAKFVRTR